MTRLRAILLLSVAVAALVFVAGCSKRDEPDPPRVDINGKIWWVDLATTRQQRYRGLSGRATIRPGTGMLFLFRESEVRDFCMRGCLVPLDIAFLDEDLRVVRTHTMAVEPDLAGTETYSSGIPSQYVLELPAGELSAAGVRVGDRATLLGDIPDAAKAEPSR